MIPFEKSTNRSVENHGVEIPVPKSIINQRLSEEILGIDDQLAEIAQVNQRVKGDVRICCHYPFYLPWGFQRQGAKRKKVTVNKFTS